MDLFGFWDLEFSHEIAAPDKSELAMTKRGRVGWYLYPVIARPTKSAQAISWKGMELPRIFQVFAVTREGDLQWHRRRHG